MQFIDLKKQYSLISTEINAAIKGVLDHGQYLMGPEITTLEKTLADYVGVKHAVAVSSGSDALLIALMALGIQPGDEVITTPFSFMASSSMIAMAGAVPVFVDIDPQTYNLDPACIEAAITPKTKAILAVDLYGHIADFNAIQTIADAHGLYVIEDAAQSFGSIQAKKRAGAFGHIATTSFFPAKPLGGYGDSGMCFTNDDALAASLNQLRNHGQTTRYHHVTLGMNARMDTLQAAILLEKFKLYEDEIQARHRVAAFYNAHLKAPIITPYIAPENNSVFAQYTIRVQDRDALAHALREHAIPTAVHYPGLIPEQPLFAHLPQRHSIPNAARIAAEVISLPMHPYLETQSLQTICEAVNAVVSDTVSVA